MARVLPIVAAFVVVLGAGTSRGDDPAPAAPPRVRGLEEMRALVLPSEGESAWREVGWLDSFGDAVVRARAEGRPIFLWAMNGHPLACV
jgi:hypothetical protein